MTTCSSCQTSIQKQYEYCPKCGNKVQYEELKKLNEEKPVNFYEQQNIVTRTSDGPLIRLMMWGSLIVYLISLWIYSAYFKEQHNRGFFFQSEENVMSVFVPILLIVVIQFVFLSTSIKTNQKKYGSSRLVLHCYLHSSFSTCIENQINCSQRMVFQEVLSLRRCRL